MADPEVAAVGDNCVDWFIGVSRFALIGGNAVNVSVQLSRLNRRAAYFGAVGDDPAGRAVIRSLADNNVDTRMVEVRSGITAYTIVERNAASDRRFVFEEFGVCADYRAGVDDLTALIRMRHVHIGWLNDGGAVRRAMAAAGTSVSQDISVNAAPQNIEVAGLDVAFASADGPETGAAETAKAMVRAGAKLAVVTRGADGSIAFDGMRFVNAAAKPVTAVDTTGAGDSFIAGFLNARLDGRSLEQCLAAGHETAAATCQHAGGFPQQPVLADHAAPLSAPVAGVRSP